MKSKKFPDILSRFRNDVLEFSKAHGGVVIKNQKEKNIERRRKKKDLSELPRKQRRKLERKLKGARKLEYLNSIKKTKTKQNGSNETKTATTTTAKSVKVKKPENSVGLIENQVKKEQEEKKKFQKSTQLTLKQKLIEDNKREEEEIARLEKKLGIKKGTEKLKKAFYDEGLADLLDFCDEDKRKDIINKEENVWFESSNGDQKKKEKKEKEKKKTVENEEEDSEMEEEEDDEEMEEDENSEDEEDEDEFDEDDDDEEEEEDDEEMNEDEDEENDDDEEEEDESESEAREKEMRAKGLKEDIYGRIVDKKGQIVNSSIEKRPSTRLQELLTSNSSNPARIKLNKQLQGLFNRLSTANMHSISNQIVQIFYSNEYTRFDIIDSILRIVVSSLIRSNSLSPPRLVLEHAALIFVLTNQIGIELGASLVQKLCQKLDADLASDQMLAVEDKTTDNLILLLCDLYNFKLISANLIVDLLSKTLADKFNALIGEKSSSSKLEKIVDLILLILRSVGFKLRRDSPVELKEAIVRLQSRTHEINNKQSDASNSDSSTNERLRFMIESINAIKNNDVRRLGSESASLSDQDAIEHIRKQMRVMLKDGGSGGDQTLLNVTYSDLIKSDELGRWWIVGSAWNLKENERNGGGEEDKKATAKTDRNGAASNGGVGGEMFSEKILKLAREQHMNTDIRRSIFCILVSAEDYTDAFVKLMKLSLKKQQEREIIYISMHCALNEKSYNPYYTFLLQKFCEYDRRFRMTLQFHTWDKFKELTTMTKQKISNFARLYSHLIGNRTMCLSVLKNIEFGEMNKSVLQFLRELFTELVSKYNDEQIQEIFMKIVSIKKFSHVRNALKLFFMHFMLTDRGKDIDLDEKLKAKFQFVQNILSLNSHD